MKFYQKKWFKVIMIVFLVLVVISVLTTKKAVIEYDVLESEITYQTEAIPAKEAVYQEPEPITLDSLSGEYLIGKSPSEYVTGAEEEFTTSQSGVYVAETDFPAGVYDLEVVSGSGNVFSGGLTGINEIMGVSDSLTSSLIGDDFYLQHYDNHVFEEGEELEVSGVSIKLVPQTNDEFKILPGTYDIKAVFGGGNVSGSGINEIMGTADKNDLIDMYVPNYDNANLQDGKTLNISGVQLEITPKEKILVSEATDAIPAKDVVEKLTLLNDVETCYIDNEETECSNLTKYDDLKSSLAANGVYTEKLSDTLGTETCYKDDKTVDCTELYDYDALKTQINS